MKKKWVKFRHKIARAFFRIPVTIYCKCHVHVKVKKFKGKGNYVILANHQTDCDQFFPFFAFKKVPYPLATEDLFSNGFVSRLLEFAANPIPFDKTGLNITAIKTCAKVVKEGGSIAIFPEGNRTYSGETVNIKSSIIKLIRLLKIPVVIYKIEGGYGAQPRWGFKGRKGKVIAYAKRVIEVEEYNNLTDDEFYDIIKKELYINECLDNKEYNSNKRAEYLERAYYYCPNCGLTEWVSHKNNSVCSKCKTEIEYTKNKTINCVKGTFPYKNTVEWMKAQNEFVSKLDINKYIDTPVYEDETRFSRVIPFKHKVLLSLKAKISLYSNRIQVNYGEKEMVFNFKDITGISVLGHNKLNFKCENTYQLKGDFRFNALKYMNFYYHYKNEKGGEENAVFLGL